MRDGGGIENERVKVGGRERVGKSTVQLNETRFIQQMVPE